MGGRANAANPPRAVLPSESWRPRSILLPLLVVVIVLAEISFLGRLDMAKNAEIVHTWTESFYSSSSSSSSSSSPSSSSILLLGVDELGTETCEEWLEREDGVPYSRDFNDDPIWISGGQKEYKSCSVQCTFEGRSKRANKPDAAFGLRHDSDTASILRSMESSHYYSDNNIDRARRKGFNIVMTTSLSSNVPVGYFSWAEYDIMAPIQPKTEPALAAAFISNCGARNFRLEALNKLEASNIKIDSYGGCHRNRDGNVDKVEALKKYKFSLAFENSIEEDYVTEKFFQSLVAGAIPVVVGAPNILDYAPAPDSILHIKTLDDVPSIAKTMQYLAGNSHAFNKSLRWKFEGPSDSFKALVDMAAVHSSCRLCIYLATQFFESDITSVGVCGLQKFKSENHIPIWKDERPEVLSGNDYKVYKIYPVGLTQRQALYIFRFKGDVDFQQFVEGHPCAKLEVVFV